jgi:Flp pilus assembly pilin Flp
MSIAPPKGRYVMTGSGSGVRRVIGSLSRDSLDGETNREYEMNELEMNVDLESGQTMAEYAVVLTVITVAAVASLALLSSTVTNLLSSLVPLI